jgi:hypothetical protein
MKKKTRRRPPDPALSLRIARAQLRAVKAAVGHFTTAQVVYAGEASDRPPQFVAGWAVNRGFSGITQALDSAGQVWERVTLMEEVMVDDKKVKQPKESWWVRVPMTRKETA